MIKNSFPPIANKDATILILGTMPGEQSLALNQYYGHSRNNFWKILFSIYNLPISTNYDDRKNLILNRNIALWDVLQFCERKGSLDSAIKNEVANDFISFFNNHPHIKHIFFNGQKAANYFKKHVVLDNNYKTTTLPSTSPANASKTFEHKFNEWKVINSL